ncbi:MAG: hypothetical protein CVU97_05885 [Firmicutes bacterium HGW-Firmicutes-21]|nr:MAG: hypothetical protein CVU97_05885 [Firmicutes bacterium HGW-Firmicutes-21]
MELTRSSDNIEIEGHIGTWYVCEEHEHNSKQVFELEHEDYGDEAAHLLVSADGTVIIDDVWNGIDDLIEDEAADEI